MQVTTLGHGTLEQGAFTALLVAAGIGRIVDVRRFPGSRNLPHFGRDAMATWLAQAGIDYRWLEALGGRRRAVEASPNQALRHPQFRAYADHMASEGFARGVSELLRLAAEAPTVVLCSESVWWRCHRRLLADDLVLLRQVPVEHLFHDGRRQPHPPMPEARLHGDHLRYPLPAA